MSEKIKKEDKVIVEADKSISNITDDTPITSGTTKYEDYEDKELGFSKFKIIEAGIRALHIENLGCIVHIEGNGAVFVPNAAILENPDGTFDLIKGRIFK